MDCGEEGIYTALGASVTEKATTLIEIGKLPTSGWKKHTSAFLGQWRFQGRGPGTRGPGDPGARVPLLFLDQTEVRRGPKQFFWRLHDRPPPRPPAYLKVWIRHCLDDGNQSEKTDECSENVNIPSVLFLSPSNKDNTKEDLFRVVNTCWERMTLVFTWKNVKTLAWRSKIYISRFPKNKITNPWKQLKRILGLSGWPNLLSTSLFFCLACLNQSGPVSD